MSKTLMSASLLLVIVRQSLPNDANPHILHHVYSAKKERKCPHNLSKYVHKV
jgi:hypothetical protein